MTRGRPAIRTRQQIMAHLDTLMIKKKLDEQAVPKGGLLFSWYMNFPKDQRPGVVGLAEMYRIERNFMRRLIERWERNEN